MRPRRTVNHNGTVIPRGQDLSESHEEKSTYIFFFFSTDDSTSTQAEAVWQFEATPHT